MVKKSIKIEEEPAVVEKVEESVKTEEKTKIPRMVIVGKDQVGNPIWKPSETEFIREE